MGRKKKEPTSYFLNINLTKTIWTNALPKPPYTNQSHTKKKIWHLFQIYPPNKAFKPYTLYSWAIFFIIGLLNAIHIELSLKKSHHHFTAMKHHLDRLIIEKDKKTNRNIVQFYRTLTKSPLVIQSAHLTQTKINISGHTTPKDQRNLHLILTQTLGLPSSTIQTIQQDKTQIAYNIIIK